MPTPSSSAAATTAEYSYDFEVPASENSTASVAAGAATATGGSATVTLNASAALGDTDGAVHDRRHPAGLRCRRRWLRLTPDSTDELSIPVPFGTTHVEVWAQDTLIAEGDVTFTKAPVTPPVTPPVTGGASGPRLDRPGPVVLASQPRGRARHGRHRTRARSGSKRWHEDRGRDS